MGLEELGVGYHRGRVRKTNQDALAVFLPQRGERGGLLIVADGMGRHQGGQIASSRVISDLGYWFQSNELGTWLLALSFHRLPILIEALTKRVGIINAELFQWGQQRAELEHMGTTVTAVWLHKDALLVAHVGDSRAYRWRRGQLQPLTRDHSWVAEQVRQGLITPSDATRHARRNQVLRALGTEYRVNIDRYIYDIEPGDLVFLCSDGLTSYYSDTELAYIFARYSQQPLQTLCNKLIQGALTRGGSDNISLIIARLSPTPTSPLRHVAVVRRSVSPAYEHEMATINIPLQSSQLRRQTTRFWLVLAIALWTSAITAFVSPFFLQPYHIGILWGLGSVALLLSVPMFVLARQLTTQ